MLSCLILAGFLASAMSAPTPATPNIDQMVQNMFQRGDTNNDGVYSKAEAWAQALKIDTDGDNLVSKKEYVATWLAVSPSLGNVGSAIFDKFDFDKNAWINQSDVNAAYALIDLDSNGEVSSSEFSAYMKPILTALLTPTPVLPHFLSNASVVLIDPNHDGYMSFEEAWANAKHYDTNGDDKVGKVEFMLAIDNNTMGIEEWPDIFDLIDTNGDQFIDKPEVVGFYKLEDADGNGLVSKAELTALMQRMGQMLTARNRITTYLDYGFWEADVNHDHKLTLDEQWNNLLLLDNNTDNKISLAEFLMIYQYHKDDIKSAATKIFHKYDTDNNGFFEKSNIAKFFNEMDVNGDGFVSENIYATFNEVMFAKAGADIRAATIALDELDFGFDDADANEDGVLSVDEQWALALAIDANGDGKVSYNEYLSTLSDTPASVKAIAPKIFQTLDVDNSTFIEKSDVVTGFKSIDTSGDGKVQKAEYVAFYTQLYTSLGISLTGGTTNVQLDFGFDEADTNHDGVISVDEQWAVAVKIDANGDGKLSSDEFLTAYANSPPALKAAVPKIFQHIDVDNSSFIEKSDVATGLTSIDTSGDGKVQKSEYVAFLTQLYASFGIVVNTNLANQQDFGFSAADTNQDGVLTVDEQWAVALTLDKNGDGKLSSEEYLVSFRNDPSFFQAAGPKLFAKFDADNSSFLERSDVVAGFALIDTSGDGRVTKKEYVTFLTEVFESTGLIIGQRFTVSIKYLFQEVDLNRDGRLSVDEQWTNLLQLDQNGDGKLTRDEYLASFATAPENFKAAGPKIFERYDSDKSGFIEKSDVAKGLAIGDKNGDGYLDFNEYIGLVSLTFNELGLTIADMIPPNLSDFGFSVIDTNHDGQVTFTEEWLSVISLDTNGDNRVSQDEYVKSLPPQLASVGPQIFQKFDSDSNGFFDKVDIRRYIALVDTNGDGTVSSAEYTSFIVTELTSLGVDLSVFNTPGTTPAS